MYNIPIIKYNTKLHIMIQHWKTIGSRNKCGRLLNYIWVRLRPPTQSSGESLLEENTHLWLQILKLDKQAVGDIAGYGVVKTADHFHILNLEYKTLVFFFRLYRGKIPNKLMVQDSTDNISLK